MLLVNMRKLKSVIKVAILFNLLQSELKEIKTQILFHYMVINQRNVEFKIEGMVEATLNYLV